MVKRPLLRSILGTLRRAVIHAPAVLACVALAIWSTFPLLRAVGSAIPGAHAGDNVSYLWNLWWFQHAWTNGIPYFTTPMLFAPFGTQLVLHTHTTLQSLLAWPLLGFASLAAAHNTVLIAGLAANGLAMYALAYQSVRAVVPSLAAAIAFAGCGYVHAHLLGHFNLTHAWVIPLFALAFIRFLSLPSYARAVLVAVAGAAVVYTDYYLTVYCAAFATIWTAQSAFAFTAVPARRRFRGLARACLVLLAVDLIVISAIAASDGLAFDVGSRHVSIHTIRNPLTVFWLVLALFVLLRWPTRIATRRRPDAAEFRHWMAWALALGLFLALIGPILAAAIRIYVEGDYVTQRVFWRSSQPGADVATLLLGHPRHFLTGAWTERAHQAIDVGLEQIAWIGLVPLILAVRPSRDSTMRVQLRMWLVVGCIFLIWSLGPFLRVAGVDTALPLPWAVARYVPLLSNARLPGRAIVMVQLATCMVAAIVLSRHRNRKAALALAVFLIAESIPAPALVYTLPRRDAVDAWLASHSDGSAVIELPAGLRDGFGDAGALDHRALVHQTMHGRPMVGGFVARLSDKVRARHAESPFLAGVLLVSRGEAPALPPDAARDAAALGIRYFVVNRDTLPNEAGLSRDALERAGFTFVVADGPRELYLGSSTAAR